MQDLMPAGFLMGKERFQSLARSMKDEISKKVMLADDADMQCLRAEEACLELKSVEKKKKTTLGLFAGVRKKKSAVPRMEKSLKLVKELDKPEEDSFCEEEAQEPAPLDYLVASDVIEGKKKQEVYEVNYSIFDSINRKLRRLKNTLKYNTIMSSSVVNLKV
jgi:hypothetical protein